MIRVGVTGGIGSGKTTLCEIFSKCDIPVYDSDTRAKQLMNSSADIHRELIAAFGEQAFVNGELNRSYIASIVFNDDNKLEQLNAIVHPQVRADFMEWSAQFEGSVPYVILESAILFNSGFDQSVDFTVAVVAPEEMRIERVCTRSEITADQVRERIAKQLSDDELQHRANYMVVNIFREDLDGAAQRLDQIFKYEASK